MPREMKDSGIEWIGEIPKNWKLPQVNYLFEIGRGRVIAKTELTNNGYPVYSSQTKNNGILGYIETYDFDKPQLTWTTDGANAGTVFLRSGKYNCTNVCGTLLPKNNLNKLSFLKYALDYVAFFNKRADINGFKIMNNEMASIKLPLPSIIEQQKIANFLDAKTSQIDNAISKTKETIEEYKKLKQAIITEAVTKGLDSNCKMKDNGVEWIGEIPNNWATSKIKRLFTLNKGLSITKDNLIEEGLSVISYGQIHSKENMAISINDSLLRFVDYERYSNNTSSKINKFDFVFADTSEDYEGCGNFVYNNSEKQLYGGYHVIILHSKKQTENKYLAYLFKTDVWRKQIREVASGVKLFSITQKTLANCDVLIPPTNEQQKITKYLDKKCSEIDNLVSKKEELIKELETYKKSLIYECVTGKREVI